MNEKQRDAFRDEAGELLSELETSLLELEQTPADTELIQRTFRALHTIKGSGAMFGFDAISHFTHEVETAFDLVRDGKLAVTPALINLTLAARDQIKALLDESSQRGSADPARGEAILAELRALVGSPQPTLETAQSQAPPAETAGGMRSWHIRFQPARDILLRGTNPLLLLRELRGLGSLTVRVNTDALPELAALDPESCYLTWELELRAACGLEAIRDVFIFVEDDCDLSIEPVEEAQKETAAQQETEPGVPKPVSTPRTMGTTSSLRVAAERLDSLVNFVGELVVVQARLSQFASRHEDPELRFIGEEIERLTAGLRDTAMSIRMLPLRATFDRFRRLVHDLTQELGKEVEFSTDGAETELDKTVIDQLSDPLLHLIRNSMDHGIEAPDARVASGKPRSGKIHLSALHVGANVLIRVSDDGRGLDPQAVRARAIEKGLISPDTELTESDVLSLILMPGFSTARQVTDLSGRGVGMDVVKRSVEALRGSVEVSSRFGEGTTVTLRLPLTLAIIDGLLVRIAGAHFIVPLSNVFECVELSREDVRRAHGRSLANVRGELVPYIRLREFFAVCGEAPAIEQIMIVETDQGRFGFAVDEVLGDHQTVIKNLGRFYAHVQVVSGATILGDGTVALILDPERIVAHAMQQAGAKGRRAGRDEQNGTREVEVQPQFV